MDRAVQIWKPFFVKITILFLQIAYSNSRLLAEFLQQKVSEYLESSIPICKTETSNSQFERSDIFGAPHT